MCVPCNQALAVLPIDLRKRNGWKQSGGEDIPEYVSRTYGRKLILISYQNQLNAVRKRFQQMIPQKRIYHGKLVDDQHVQPR